MSRTRSSQPVYSVITELLEKKQGATTDVELFNALKEIYDDLSFSAFNKALMKLEIEGVVHVSSLTKNKRRIELLRKLEGEKGPS